MGPILEQAFGAEEAKMTSDGGQRFRTRLHARLGLYDY